MKWDIETSDLQVFARQVGSGLKPFRFLETNAGTYNAAMLRMRFGPLNLNFIKYGESVTIDAGCLNHFALLQVPIHGSFRLHNCGRTAIVQVGEAHLLPPTVPLIMEWSPDCLLFAIRFELAASDFGDYDHIHFGGQTEFGSFADLHNTNGKSLGAILDLLLHEAREQRFLQETRFANGAYELLNRVIAGTFAQNSNGAKPSDAPAYLSRILQFIDASIANEINLKELARAAGVSERTLYRAFEIHIGRSPSGWIKIRRLDRIRKELSQRGPSGTTVTQVAQEWGVSHFGRFSADYRRQFGEYPIDTLRRTTLESGRGDL